MTAAWQVFYRQGLKRECYMYLSKFTFVFENNSNYYPGHKVILNSLNRNFHLLPSNYAEAIIRNDCEALEKIKTFLIEHNYAYMNEHDEKQQEEKIQSMYYEEIKKAGMQFYIMTTRECNLRCSYCFQKEFSLEGKAQYIKYEMIDEAVKIVQDKIFEESEYTGLPVVYLYGGEPFLATKESRGILKYGINKARMFGIPLGAVTNGTNVVQYLKAFKGVNKGVFTITLDGTKEYHDKRKPDTEGNGTFDRIVDCIQQCLDNEFPVILKVIVDSDTIDNLPEFAEWLDKKGWLDIEADKFRIQLSENLKEEIKLLSHYRETGEKGVVKGARHHLDLLKRLKHLSDNNESFQKMFHPECYGIDNLYYHGKVDPPKLSGCPAGTLLWVFGPDGKLYNCLNDACNLIYPVGEYYPEYKLYKEKHEWWKNRSVDKNSVCITCKYKYTCAGGCASHLEGSDVFYCKPIHEIMQVGMDIYLPKILERKNLLNKK
jgi:uncharacterized protein